MSESPKIVLPEDELIKEALEKKLEDYNRRLEPFVYVHSDVARKNPRYADSLYKSIIVKKLLQDGIVNTFDLSYGLAKDYGFLDEEAYNNAAAVIDDYCRTGGKNTSKGTVFGK